MSGDGVVSDWNATDQMFLNNSLNYIGCAGSIPCSVRINDSDRPLFADLQAVRFGSIDAALAGQAKLDKTLFKVIPGLKAFLFS